MRAFLLSDGEYLTLRHAELQKLVSGFLAQKSFELEQKTIERDELQFCRGCFDCWVKTPGECIMKDGIVAINRACMLSDVVVYLCPIVFGQFSANMKSAIDRWLPNMLPFFMTRKDGSTMHPPRYADYPKLIFIGYADAMSGEEAQLFSDISLKHRSNVEMIIDCGDDDAIRSVLQKTQLTRIGGAL
jgi:multimeric flavodoxin WrbA